MSNQSNPTANRELVFVYGTLMRGFGNHRVMRYAQGELQARATVPGELIHLGGYPGFRRAPKGTVHGEIYAVPPSGFGPLDSLEGVPNLYTRERIQATTEDGQTVECWIYVYARDGRYAYGVLESGDWRDEEVNMLIRSVQEID
jgi:gamma-glutamylcyclotransferase (GGCT)/AIG2-like uncharacterized protein YtfP